MSSDEEDFSDEVQIIEDFSSDDEPPTPLENVSETADPFAQFLGDEDDDMDVEELDIESNQPGSSKSDKDAPNVNLLPLNSFAGGGIFSVFDDGDDLASAGGRGHGHGQDPATTLDGTSIIGDSIYTKPDENAKLTEKFKLPVAPNLTAIKNKTVKRELYRKYLKEKQKVEKLKNRERRKKRMKETDEERDAKKKAFGATTAQVDYHQKTIENMREWDETTVPVVSQPGKLPTELKLVADPEIQLEETADEFAAYFRGEITPKVLITTSENARNKTWKLAMEMGSCIPNSFVLKRKRLAVKQIIKQALKKEFTSVIVINDDRGKPNGMLVSHLPEGPTALFRLSSPILRCELGRKDPRGAKGLGKEHQQPTNHKPELILKRFGTRLGHRVSKLFASLYPYDPDFRGRQVATVYNQRDFIFFRMHRYQFTKYGKKVSLQEMGPRFTLRLRSLQMGTFDSKMGDYEWIAKRHVQDTSRRKFHL